MTFPLLKLSGTPTVIGQSHGEAFREKIHRVWDFYRSILGKITDEELNLHIDRIGAHVEKHFPQFIQEMRGIAQGAALDPRHVFGLNFRTELLQLIELPPHECTSVYFSASSILGQNWDFGMLLEPLTVILEIEREGRKFFTLTEAGMVGKIGMNSDGIGVSLNRLTSRRRLDGIPVHILLRAALEIDSLESFRQTLQRVPIGSESNVMVANDRGEGSSFEISGAIWTEHRNSPDYLVHANTYLGFPEEEFSTADDIEHSRARLDRAEELTKKSSRDSWKAMLQILMDRTHPKYPICRDYEDSPTLGKSGTISAIIMDLPKRCMYYTPGNPHLHEPVCLDLN